MPYDGAPYVERGLREIYDGYALMLNTALNRVEVHDLHPRGISTYCFKCDWPVDGRVVAKARRTYIGNYSHSPFLDIDKHNKEMQERDEREFHAAIQDRAHEVGSRLPLARMKDETNDGYKRMVTVE